jgi:hypothetical protein
MAGVLSFTLGLEGSNFLRTLGMASGQVLSFAAVMEGVSRIAGATWAQIERGGALSDLSARTGESVRGLYQLEEALKVAGLGAGSLAPMLGQLQQAMSGIDMRGERTEKVFWALGLDLEQLRKAGAVEQFEALAGALGQLDKTSAAGVAAKLFGREGGGAFLQVARDMAGFREALAASAQTAALFEERARAFDRIGDTLTIIKSRVGGLFAGIAEGAAPALQAILDFVNGLDFEGIGQRIGGILTAITQAFREGRVSELIAVSIHAGLVAGFKALPDLVIAGFAKALENKYVKMVIGATSPLALAGLELYKGPGLSWSEISKGALASMLDDLGEAGAPLQKLIDELVQNAGAPRPAVSGAKLGRSLSGLLQSEGKGYKPEFTEIEKLGFVFTGGGPGALDYQRQTSVNTAKMVDLFKIGLDLLTQQLRAATFANIG